jgi:hypothetical protein
MRCGSPRPPRDTEMRKTESSCLFDDLDDDAAANFNVKGTNVLHVSTQWKRITVELTNPDAVYTIARMPGVRMVRPVYIATTNAGIVTSQAVHALRSNRASNRYGVNGAGQKVGVISDSFARTGGVRDGNTTPPSGASGILQGARNQDSGDLPPQVQIIADYPAEFSDGSDEGAGMAELVHDIVPGADIAFHSAFISEAGFADGITLLRNAGCTVVVDDVIYLTEPMFQEGIIAQSARNCVAAGVPYFSSAGNGKNTALRFNFRDTNPAVDTEGVSNTSTDDYHRWDNGTSFIGITVLPFNPARLILQWNQPFESVSPGNGSQIDLSMVFYAQPNSQAPVLAIVDDLQGTTGSPKGDALEFAVINNQDSGPVTYYLAINHVRGMQDGIPQNPDLPVECRLVVFGAEARIEGVTSDLNIYGGPSQYGHSIATGVMGVGAIPWYDTAAFDLNLGATPQIDAQDFTALGGNLRLYFNDAGALNVRDRFCPDIAATNGENTTFFGSPLDLLGYQGEPDGFPNFFGTSAAAPNAAAVAALMKSLDPSLTPDEIRDIMTSTAIDVTGRRAAPGVDDTTGAGLVDAQAALDVVAGGLGITPVPTPAGTPAPKFKRVFSGSPEPDVENPADPLERDFSGWEFVPGHNFFPPSEGNVLGSPVLITSDNTNTFGFFESPTFIAGPWQRSGDLPLNGNNGAYNLYRADFTVRTSVPADNQGAIPTIRFRATTDNNEQSDMLVLTSNTTENVSPNTAPLRLPRLLRSPRHPATLPRLLRSHQRRRHRRRQRQPHPGSRRSLRHLRPGAHRPAARTHLQLPRSRQPRMGIPRRPAHLRPPPPVLRRQWPPNRPQRRLGRQQSRLLRLLRLARGRRPRRSLRTRPPLPRPLPRPL